MIRWILSWLWEIGWYVLLASGWLCWFRAHQRAERLTRHLAALTTSWRDIARKEWV